MSKLSAVGFAYLLCVVLAATLAVPYTKVEESFNMQAIHDLLHLDVRPHLRWSLCSQKKQLIEACSRADLLGRINCVAGGFIVRGTAMLMEAANTFRIPPSELIDNELSVENNRDFVHCEEGDGAEGTLFDHVQFPGVVPRTFVGAAMLATLLTSVIAVVDVAGLGWAFVALDQGLTLQIAARLFLAEAVVFSCWAMAKAALSKREDGRARALFYVMVASCFHVCFYASRTLPNTFALVGVNMGLTLLFSNRNRSAFALLGATAAVFRSDVLVLIFPLAIVWVFVLKRVSLVGGAVAGLMGAVAAVAVTAPFDSVMWGRPLWPEAEVLLFNTVENRSGEWGVSPAHWYFTSALPKAFLGCTGLALAGPIVGCWRSFRSKQANAPALVGACVLVFVSLYSVLPHKEVRFILIGFPALLLCAAQFGVQLTGLPSALLTKGAGRGSSALHFISATLLVLMCTAPMVALGGLQIYAANANYPGAVALQIVNSIPMPMDAQSHVFIDAYGGMTGVTRFLKQHHPTGTQPHVVYNKDPALFNFEGGNVLCGVEGEEGRQPFDFVILRNEWVPQMEKACGSHFIAISSVDTVDAVLYKSLRFTSKPFLVIFARKLQ